DKRVVIITEIGDGIAFVLLARVLPLAFLHVILRVRESGNDFVSLTYGIPSAMIEVQMGVDDDVDIFGRNTRGAEIIQQFSGLTIEVDQAAGQFIPEAGLNQDSLIAGGHQHGIDASREQVLLVGFFFPFPHDLGDHAKENSAIQVIGTVRDGGEFEIAEREAVHGSVHGWTTFNSCSNWSSIM